MNVLDPATGTGTFLVEAIDLIHSTLVSKWEHAGRTSSEIRTLWNDYVPTELLPRLHGYELMMAPYAIAHLKIGLKLHETNYDFVSNERARVYLTMHWSLPTTFRATCFRNPRARTSRAAAVNAVKPTGRFTVVRR